MMLPSRARRKLSFRPQVEKSESRFLLSAAGLAHADASRSSPIAAEIKDRFAYSLAGVVRDTTPIYSLYVTNDTGDNLTVTLSTPEARKTQRNFTDGASLTSNEDILMFTDKISEWKFNVGLRVAGKDIKGSFSFKPKNGMQTTVKQGFQFAPTPGWFDNDLGLSMQYKVQIEGTCADKKLVLMPAL